MKDSAVKFRTSISDVERMRHPMEVMTAGYNVLLLLLSHAVAVFLVGREDCSNQEASYSGREAPSSNFLAFHFSFPVALHPAKGIH